MAIIHHIGQFYYFQRSRSSRIFVMLRDHFQRGIDLIKSLANTIMALNACSVPDSPHQSAINIYRFMAHLSHVNPNKIGEHIKATRNLLVASLDRSDMMGKKLTDLISAEHEADKKMYSIQMMHCIKDNISSIRDRINISHIYKVIPHPDADMPKVFDKIRGLSTPNIATPEAQIMVDCCTRKAILLSLIDSGHNIMADPHSANKALADIINSTNMARKRMLLANESPLTFQGVNFLKDRSLPDLLDVKVPISDRASAPSVHFDDKQQQKEKDLSKTNIYVGLRSENAQKLKPINDIISELKGDSKLDARPAWSRFQEVVKLHEEFESRYPGMTPEQIPSEDLDKFVRSLGDKSYTVLTEPKLGETHKEITRLFYMGEQQLKKMTQLVERLARQISGKQVGVSIVKTHAARRRDLERFSTAMHDVSPDVKPVFVSFDMSSFSMKFPMELVRSFGRMLGELTDLPDLGRIDLFFRNALVYHNSRGYFDSIGGVLGGFEGFLNFVWSSIHASVAEMAQIQAGVTGQLLTYSDDGLLLFYVPVNTTNEEIQEKIYSIRHSYAAAGLEFNIGKTLISGNVWEYLGEVCYDSHLLECWFKELASFSVVETSSAYNPMMQRAKVITSQASALARAGLDSDLCELLCAIEVSLMITRTFSDVTKNTLLWLLVLPSGMGGFRIPDSFEMACTTTISPDSYVAADLHLMAVSRPEEASRVFNYLLDHQTDRLGVIRSILMGSRFSFDLPDVTGLKEANHLVHQVKLSAIKALPAAESPITDSILANLSGVLPLLENINPTTLREIVTQTPAWKEYFDSVAIVLSSSSIKILPHKKIVQAMVRDRRSVVAAVSALQRCMAVREETILSATSFIMRYKKGSLDGLSLSPMRAAPKSLYHIVPISHPNDITVVIKKSTGITEEVRDIYYVEPHEAPKEKSPLLAWVSEFVATTAEARTRRFLRVIASAYVASPASYDFLVYLSSLFGVVVPPVPLGVGGSINRYRSYTSERPDVMISTFTPFLARSTVITGPSLRPLFSQSLSADRTTYLQAARFYAINKCQRLGKTKGLISENADNEISAFNFLGEYMPSFCPSVMGIKSRLPAPLNVGQGPAGIGEEFLKAINDDVNASMATAIIRNYSDLSASEVREKYVTYQGLMVKVTADWIRKIIWNRGGTGTAPLLQIPVSVATMQSISRSALRQLCHEWLTQVTPREYSLWLSSYRGGVVVQQNQSIEDAIFTFMQKVIENAAHIPKQLLSEDLVISSLAFSNDLAVALVKIYSAAMIINKSSIPVIVMDKSDTTKNLATAAKVAALDTAIRTSVNYIYASASVHNWKSEHFSGNIPHSTENPLDWFLNISAIMTSKLRPSPHRGSSHLANSRTIRIEYFKMVVIMNEVLYRLRNRRQEIYTLEDAMFDVDNLVLSPIRIQDAISAIFARGSLPGPDHSRLLSGPLEPSVAARARIMVRYQRSYHRCQSPRDWEYTNAQDIVSRATLDFSSYYTLYIQNLLNREAIFSSTEADTIINEFDSDHNPSVNLLEITNLATITSFKAVYDASIVGQYPEAAAALISKISSTQGIIALKIDPNLQMNARLAIILGVNNVSSDSSHVSLTVGEPTDRSLRIASYRSKTLSELVGIYLMIHGQTHAIPLFIDLSTQQRTRYGLIIVTYGMFRLPTLRSSGASQCVVSRVQPSSLLTYDVNLWALASLELSGWRTSHNQVPTMHHQVAFPSAELTSGTARLVKTQYLTVKDHPLLVAATILANGIRHASDPYIAYSLLRHEQFSHKRVIDTLPTLLEYAKPCTIRDSIISDLKDMNSFGKMAGRLLQADVAAVASWLKHFSVTPELSETTVVSNIMTFAWSLRGMLAAPVRLKQISLGRPRSLVDVMKSPTFNQFKIPLLDPGDDDLRWEYGPALFNQRGLEQTLIEYSDEALMEYPEDEEWPLLESADEHPRRQISDEATPVMLERHHESANFPASMDPSSSSHPRWARFK